MLEDQKKKYCLVDRGHLSTILYNLQKPNKKEWINKVYKEILQLNRLPDIYIILDISSKTSLERKKQKELDGENIWANEESLKINKLPTTLRSGY